MEDVDSMEIPEHVYDGAYLCTSEEYEELKKWWEEEVEAMNNKTQGHDLDYSECCNDYTAIFAD